MAFPLRAAGAAIGCGSFPAAGVGQWIDDGTRTGGFGATARFYRVKLLWTKAGNTPPLNWIQRNTSGQPVLLFAGLPDDGRMVEYTTNLTSGSWTSLPSAARTFPVPGLCQWTDDGTLTGSSAGQARYYRIRQQERKIERIVPRTIMAHLCFQIRG